MATSVLAPCKINLGLHVLARRDDGYHDIDTVFLRIPWCDEVSWRPGSGRSMTCSDPTLPTDERNLCMAAALRLAEEAGVGGGFALHLEKRVPYGAGLGSGSSDAAAVLRMLQEPWGADDATLWKVAAALGSDVPFFLGAPAARGTGRGEVLGALGDYRCPHPFVLVVPPVHVSTAAAYGMITPRSKGRTDLVAVVRSNDLDRWREDLLNDFQAPVAKAYPAVGHVMDRLWGLGADYAAMSGSGSSVFGVCESLEVASAIAEEMAGEGCATWSGFAGDP